MVGVRAAAAAAELDDPPPPPPPPPPSSCKKYNGEFSSKPHPHHPHQHPQCPPLEMAPVKRIGAGLSNLGNTCFLNSVIQCLTYTPPLAAYLQANLHKGSCQVRGFCAMCALENHAKQALSSAPGRVLSPIHLVKNLRAISRSFQMWRQEDAHEYMRYLIEALQKCCPREVSPGSSHKNYIERVFGGRLRSQVKCTQCSHCSNTFDPFLDLSLEIVKAESLAKALARFTAVEVLDGNNKYQCSKCKKKVRAFKQFTIDHAPHVLTIQLKRFATSGGFGGKIDKKVQFDRTFDIKPFVNRGEHTELRYSLYAVLVHSGWSTHSGHYYCFVRTTADTWHVLDDSRVSQVSEKTVLDQKAYMLFYIRDLKTATTPVGMVDRKKTADSGAPGMNVNGVSVAKPHETSAFKHKNSEATLMPVNVGIESSAAKANKNSSACISDYYQYGTKEPPGSKPKTSGPVENIGFIKIDGNDPTVASGKQRCQKALDRGFSKVSENVDSIGKDQERGRERDPSSKVKHGRFSALDIGNHRSGRDSEAAGITSEANGYVPESQVRIDIDLNPTENKASLTGNGNGYVAEFMDLNLQSLEKTKTGHDDGTRCKASTPNFMNATLNTSVEESDLGHSELNGESPVLAVQGMDEGAKESHEGSTKKVRKKQTSEQNVSGLYRHTKRRKMSGEAGKYPFRASNGSKSHDEVTPSAQVKKQRKKPWIFGLKLFLRRHRFRQMSKSRQDAKKAATK